MSLTKPYSRPSEHSIGPYDVLFRLAQGGMRIAVACRSFGGESGVVWRRGMVEGRKKRCFSASVQALDSKHFVFAVDLRMTGSHAQRALYLRTTGFSDVRRRPRCQRERRARQRPGRHSISLAFDQDVIAARGVCRSASARS